MGHRVSRRNALRTMLAAGAIGPAEVAWSQVGNPADSSATLPVLFFNTHLLPGIAQGIAGHRGQDAYRTQAIAAQLSGYDVVGLCEVFEARRRREITRIARQNSDREVHAIEPPKV